MSAPRVAVVGHVEWTRLVLVDRCPAPGDIAHAEPLWEGPAGGGAVAAVQLAKLAGGCTLLTALGDDATGERARRELAALGVTVDCALRQAPTREAVSLIDREGERTTVTLGPRLQPEAADPLGWAGLADHDAVYFAAGDISALQRARLARVLVSTARELETVAASTVALDALVGSGRDPAERVDRPHLPVASHLVVVTDGRRGGWFVDARGAAGRYDAAALPGPLVDTYGLGDSFAGALTFALCVHASATEALALAARCAAACATGRGPFEAQLLSSDLLPEVDACRPAPAEPHRGVPVAAA